MSSFINVFTIVSIENPAELARKLPEAASEWSQAANTRSVYSTISCVFHDRSLENKNSKGPWKMISTPPPISGQVKNKLLTGGEEDLSKRVTAVRMSAFPKLIYTLNVILIKSQQP